MMEDGKKPNRLLGRERREGGKEGPSDGPARYGRKSEDAREEKLSTGGADRRKLGVALRLWVYPPTLLGGQGERAARTRSGHQQAETEAECMRLGKEVGGGRRGGEGEGEDV